MSSLTLLRLAAVGGLFCGLTGITLGFIFRKIKSRGWIGLLLLFFSALMFITMEPASTEKMSRPLCVIGFATLTPFAVIYSCVAFKKATDRLAAKAALAGSIVMGGLFLFFLVGIVSILVETFLDHP